MGPRSLAVIRPAELSDCEALASIYQESLDARDSSMEVETSASSFEAQLRAFHEREVMLVVETDSGVQGWGVVKRYSDRHGYRVTCETSIYLRRSATGKGLGKLLQAGLMERARGFGYHHIVAKIWASNSGSIRFHQSFGYELVGVQKEVGFLDGKWLDVAILQCLL